MTKLGDYMKQISATSTFFKFALLFVAVFSVIFSFSSHSVNASRNNGTFGSSCTTIYYTNADLPGYTSDEKIIEYKDIQCTTVSTDKSAYAPGETVTISGIIPLSPITGDAFDGILILAAPGDPSDQTVDTGGGFLYSTTFNAPDTPGTYTVSAESYGLTATATYTVAGSNCSLFSVSLPPSVSLGTPIYAAGVTDLRAAIIQLYFQVTGTHLDLDSFGNTDPLAINGGEPTELVSGNTVIRAAHYIALRDAVNAIYTQCGLPEFSWTKNLVTGQPILAQHFNDFLTAIRALPSQSNDSTLSSH